MFLLFLRLLRVLFTYTVVINITYYWVPCNIAQFIDSSIGIETAGPDMNKKLADKEHIQIPCIVEMVWNMKQSLPWACPTTVQALLIRVFFLSCLQLCCFLIPFHTISDQWGFMLYFSVSVCAHHFRSLIRVFVYEINSFLHTYCYLGWVVLAFQCQMICTLLHGTK